MLAGGDAIGPSLVDAPTLASARSFGSSSVIGVSKTAIPITAMVPTTTKRIKELHRLEEGLGFVSVFIAEFMPSRWHGASLVTLIWFEGNDAP